MSDDLLAIKSFPYAGRRVRAGETFAVRTRAHARLLVAMRRARLVGPPSDHEVAPSLVDEPEPGAPYEAPAIVPAESPATPDERPRRRYRRRDLVAEDE